MIDKTLLSTFLQYSCGLKAGGGEGRTYPSAGSRYPLEVYPIVFVSSDTVPAGVYHYNVEKHALDVLLQKQFAEDETAEYFSYEWASKASVAIIITALFARTQNKYSERGYRDILIEAGHVGQNMYLAAEALGLQCCAIAGTRDEEIEKLLDVDGVTESLVYALLLD